MSVTSLGYILCLFGGTLLFRIIRLKTNQKDVFNTEAETFPREEQLLENESSFNLSARYRLKNKWRKSWISFINGARGIMVCGGPGSGKSFLIIEELIRQSIKKNFAIFIFDLKFDGLSIIAYNYFLQHKHNYKVPPEFYVINFDDLTRTNRCNPIDPRSMTDVTDALSERFGKIMQERESFSINSNDTSISRSKQLDLAIPPSKIANLSSGEFVGTIADNPNQKIAQKIFHCEIINDPAALKKKRLLLNRYLLFGRLRKK